MSKTEIIEFLTLPQFKGFVHASNLLTKAKKDKYFEIIQKCVEKYIEFCKGFDINDIDKTVKNWNNYLNFVRKINKDKNNNLIFSAQSKLESTIIEECLHRMFINYERDNIKIGGIKAYSNMMFIPYNFCDFNEISRLKINTKDQDFAIYKQVNLNIENNIEPITAYVPVVAMECKTYLDKTMLEGSIATAEKLKSGNPYCRFCIVTEYYEVDKTVDISSSRIDQIYILKKNATKKEYLNVDIFTDVVEILYKDTINHLSRQWSDIKKNIENKGVIFG
jgi:hypothetical protein